MRISQFTVRRFLLKKRVFLFTQNSAVCCLLKPIGLSEFGAAQSVGPQHGDIYQTPRTRVNISMLAQYIGKPVCFVGRVEKVHPSGSSFVVSDGQGKNTTVELSEPLAEELSGVIEGRVTPKATIMSMSLIPFREDAAAFDLSLYDEPLKIIHEFPQYYPFGVVSSD